MSYAVSRRTNEIGVRMALGAGRSSLLWMVMRESLTLVMIGLAVGLGAALAATRVVASQLYGLKPHDPATVAAAVCLLLAVAALCRFFARRARPRGRSLGGAARGVNFWGGRMGILIDDYL